MFKFIRAIHGHFSSFHRFFFASLFHYILYLHIQLIL